LEELRFNALVVTLQRQIGDHLLERRGLTPKIVDLVRGGGPGCIGSATAR
jgi:hypothetical protein